MILRTLAFSLLLCLGGMLSAQVTTLPLLPLQTDTVTIRFDASAGNGALAGFSGNVYAHTGVITQNSTSPSDWKNVQGTWATDDPRVRMNQVAPDVYELRYHIPSYYNLSPTDTVLQLSFVFRNQDGTIVGRAPDGSDIYVDIARPELTVAFVQPNQVQNLLDTGDSIQIQIGSIFSDSVKLFENGQEIEATDQSSLAVSYKPATPGNYTLIAEASDAMGASVFDTLFVYLRDPNPPVAALPAGAKIGINYEGDTAATLVLFAPGKSYAFVIGSFNDWEISQNSEMNVTPDGDYFWKRIGGLTPGEEYPYQYWVDGTIKIADPYTEKILDPFADPQIEPQTYPNLMPYPTGKTTGIVSVLQPGKMAYNWAIDNFDRPKVTDLVIYELHIRDFVAAHNYATVIDSLDYLERLGVNAIELMPVMEFENNDSWGYNPSFMFAPDKYYGPESELKRLIDSCHARGMAVILDIVLNHQFGQSPLVQLWFDGTNNRPATDNPYFNPVAKHDFNVGYDMNHDNPATQYFSSQVMKHWINEYRIDGYRFDLSKGFTQKNTLGDVGAWGRYDTARVELWTAYRDSMYEADSGVYIILEHFADRDEEEELAARDMLIWGNEHGAFSETVRGFPRSFQGVDYASRGYDDPHLIAYMESHDEERIAHTALTSGRIQGGYNIRELGTAMQRIAAASALFYTIPGPKMLWQFGELGYDVPINFNGRTGRKPIRWEYLDIPERRRLYQVTSALINLRIEEPVFETEDYSLALGGGRKRIILRHPSMDAIVIGNLELQAGNIDPQFTRPGVWYEYFSGDSLNISDVDTLFSIPPGGYEIYTTKRLQTPELVSVSNDQDLPLLAIRLYPNPAQDVLNVDMMVRRPEMLTLKLVDVTGRVIRSVETEVAPGQQHQPLSVKGLPTGIYILHVQLGSQQVARQILVE